MEASVLKRVWRENALSIVLIAAFAMLWLGQAFTGWRVYNHEQDESGHPAIGFASDLRTGHFVELAKRIFGDRRDGPALCLAAAKGLPRKQTGRRGAR